MKSASGSSLASPSIMITSSSVPDIDEIQVAHDSLAVHRIHHELAVDAADANRANRAGEGNVGNAKRRARAVHEEDVRIVFAVGAQENADDLCVVEVALREQRAKRAIRHPAGENFLLGRTAFPLEIAAGKFSDSRRFLAVVDSEREEILTFLDRGGRYGGDENDGFAGTNCDCTIGESREFAGFNGDWGLADGGRNGVRHNICKRFVPATQRSGNGFNEKPRPSRRGFQECGSTCASQASRRPSDNGRKPCSSSNPASCDAEPQASGVRGATHGP